MDNKTAAERSRNMSHIHSRDTKPEITVRKLLFADGFRYRLNVKDLPGKPDLVLKKYHAVIFINGCFWHGHANCRYAKTPETNAEFWTTKIETNKARDAEVRRRLLADGWRVLTVWTCSLRNAELLNKTHRRIKAWLLGDTEQAEICG